MELEQTPELNGVRWGGLAMVLQGSKVEQCPEHTVLCGHGCPQPESLRFDVKKCVKCIRQKCGFFLRRKETHSELVLAALPSHLR